MRCFLAAIWCKRVYQKTGYTATYGHVLMANIMIPLKFKVPYFQTILDMVIQGDFKLILFGDLLNLVISWFKYHRSKTHIFFNSPLVSSYCSILWYSMQMMTSGTQTDPSIFPQGHHCLDGPTIGIPLLRMEKKKVVIDSGSETIHSYGSYPPWPRKILWDCVWSLP